ncbi:MAG: aspartyl-tRNA(Asn)/glutamyl-tRNA(Gln) amidotransferase subunit C [Planctomycetota bacterium]|jgi:aspartyl-tRNA(Asn)/glutamyl-tRNA(Gln) amidotransferase subunit C
MYTGLHMAVKITREQVDGLCALARMALSDTEKQELTADLDNILGYVSMIEAVDAPEELSDRYMVQNIVRGDIDPYTPREFTDVLVAAMPKKQGGYLEVQNIL